MNRRALCAGLSSLLVLGLFGCAVRPPVSSEAVGVDELVRHGRFALRAEAPNENPEAVQGGFLWRDVGRRLTLDLTNPFGNILARVDVEPGQASLTQSNGEVLRASDPDGLVQQAIGQRIPVKDLRVWLRASLRTTSTMQHISRDDQGRITRFELSGWTVERSRFDALGPRLLVLSRVEGGKQITIRLVVDVP